MTQDEEEDDYLSMTFEDAAPSPESSLQRTSRLKREAADRGRVPSKKELAAREQQSRDKALATHLDSSNRGAKMMAKMGFQGGALGVTEGARTEPIELQMKIDKGGIGMDNEKKRKIREAAEALHVQEKRQKMSEAEYRERNRLESEERQQKAQLRSATRTCEEFDTGEGADVDPHEGNIDETPKKDTSKRLPLRSINVLWRGLVKQRFETERERCMQLELMNGLSRQSNLKDPDSDEESVSATKDVAEEDIEEEDPELDEFEALGVGERLEKLVHYLRTRYKYCFWCKYRYPDEAMEGCPGLTEDEHG